MRQMYCSFFQLLVRGVLFEYYWSVLTLQKNIAYYSHNVLSSSLTVIKDKAQ